MTPDYSICIMQLYSRLHSGGAGENAAVFTLSSVHVVVAIPISSKPELQV